MEEEEDDRMPQISLQTRTEIVSECYHAEVQLLFQLEKSIYFVSSAYELLAQGQGCVVFIAYIFLCLHPPKLVARGIMFSDSP